MTDPLLEQLVVGFAQEAEEIAGRLTLQLLELEKSPSREALDEVARGLHTLKGSSATLGLEELSGLAHEMEELLVPGRAGDRAMPAAIADALLRALDAFVAQVKAAAVNGPVADLSEPRAFLAAARAVHVPSAPSTRPAAGPATSPGPRPGPSQPPGSSAATSPAATAAPSPGPDGEDGWRVKPREIAGLQQEVERLRELRLRLDERRRELDRGVAMLTRLGLLAETAETRALFLGASRALLADGEEIADVVAGFEETLKSITIAPLQLVFEPLRRAVRDLCRATGKEARLHVVGAEVSVDRRVLDGLRGPLVQLVRNAIDHGLETPDRREAAGKRREGALEIRVDLAGDLLFLEVSDDGSGLDVDRIRESAIRFGLTSPEELAAMAPQQLCQLIFRAGFTTRESAGALSGRGMGLDVVRSQIEQLRGQVGVESTRGQGTRFLITLPASLGSSPILVVRVGEHLVGIPMTAIESSHAARTRLLDVGRARVLFPHQDRAIVVHDLGALLGLRQPQVPSEGTPLLVLQQPGVSAALAVDEVIGDKELLVRPLPPEVRDVPAWQGAATLARGELLLVLRPEWLAQLAEDRPAAVVGSRRALVVDDSLTARALNRTSLESGGFVVHTASDGRQALEQLRSNAYEVLVTDIGMPGLDGFELTQTVRTRHLADGMAIVLVTARDSDVDRGRGRDSGAEGFVSKRECASGRLLGEVASAIARRRGGAA